MRQVHGVRRGTGERRARKGQGRKVALGVLVALALLLPASAGARTSRDDVSRLQAELNRAAAEYNAALSRYEGLQRRTELARARAAESRARYEAVARNIRLRARRAYEAGASDFLEALLLAPDLTAVLNRLAWLNRIAQGDAASLAELRKAASEWGAAQKDLEASLGRERAALERAEALRKKLEEKLEKARIALAAEASRPRTVRPARVRITGNMACPVAGPHAFSNDWGAPRSGHRHQGTDIFAPYGTPAVAITSGYIKYLKSGGSGGIMLWLWGDDGNEYFYAHLSGYAPGTSVGRRVGTGEVVAYVGNSGNARGSSPHLHFEIHPGGGAPVNPYPVLVQIC